MISDVIAKKWRRIYERVHTCMYVGATLTLQHVSFLTLEGMNIPFLVVPTAVKTFIQRTHSLGLETTYILTLVRTRFTQDKETTSETSF